MLFGPRRRRRAAGRSRWFLEAECSTLRENTANRFVNSFHSRKRASSQKHSSCRLFAPPVGQLPARCGGVSSHHPLFTSQACSRWLRRRLPHRSRVPSPPFVFGLFRFLMIPTSRAPREISGFRRFHSSRALCSNGKHYGRNCRLAAQHNVLGPPVRSVYFTTASRCSSLLLQIPSRATCLPQPSHPVFPPLFPSLQDPLASHLVFERCFWPS